jgi:hypothetical protein
MLDPEFKLQYCYNTIAKNQAFFFMVKNIAIQVHEAKRKVTQNRKMCKRTRYEFSDTDFKYAE